MNLKTSKEYRWEMGHRLPFHEGPCKNVHGHSYRMRLEFEGTTNENSMLIDFYDIDKIMSPIILKLDHAFLCDAEDEMMINFCKSNDFKYYVMPRVSTVENIVQMLISEIQKEFVRFENLKRVRLRVYETEDSYSEIESELR
jgi:6-pyruvoyltetrahydropterin/6-carboxytetrahydropterin synthase